ncbi:hypothetical protein LY78DRAFT_660806 [Colletotrichum sublineola]|nr:hypothetical protein LY78DRAFT_660806 [Colletotrichum sublineola]
MCNEEEHSSQQVPGLRVLTRITGQTIAPKPMHVSERDAYQKAFTRYSGPYGFSILACPLILSSHFTQLYRPISICLTPTLALILIFNPMFLLLFFLYLNGRFFS